MIKSQFDALCSFAFNIGPKAFLKSDTLRALNNGRPLDAANGLDIWRKSEIAGKTYVVDALMRRRTAEKALFLRANHVLPAGREDLPPVRDTTITGLSTEDALPVFTADDANGIVATAPYEAVIAPSRRREDGPVGALQLSELDIIDDDAFVENTEFSIDTELFESDALIELDEDESKTLDIAPEDTVVADLPFEGVEPLEVETRQSPIAAAASDIVARLDALIEDSDARFEGSEAEWPESLITAEVSENEAGEVLSTDLTEEKPALKTTLADANVIDMNTRTSRKTQIQVGGGGSDFEGGNAPQTKRELKSAKPVMIIDELAQDDAFRIRTDSAAKYIETSEAIKSVPVSGSSNSLGLWIPVLLGFILVGLAGGTLISGSERLLGEWGPIIAFTGFVIGLGLILAGVYAALRMNLRD